MPAIRPALELIFLPISPSRCRNSFWFSCYVLLSLRRGRALARSVSALAANKPSRFHPRIGIVFPVAYAIAIKAVLFDGMRHFIFVLPLIAVAAALSPIRACDPAGAPSVLAADLCRCSLIYGIAHISIMAMLHPDQYVYYNAFVGGVEGAQRKFKLDYWANSYAEAVQGSRKLFARRVWSRFRGPRVYCRSVRAADLGRLLFSAEFPFHPPTCPGRFLHRFH